MGACAVGHRSRDDCVVFVEPLGFAYDAKDAAPYGRAYFVDVRSARAVRIDSRAACERERARISPVYR